MIAVITGGTSFIGAALSKCLLDAGVVCYAIVRPESKRISAFPQGYPGLHIVRGRLDSPETWVGEIPKCDAFFHFAWDGVSAKGRADPNIQHSNVGMAIMCLKTAARLGTKRFVFSGSQAEYGLIDGPITEDSPCTPVIEYGKGKLQFLGEAEKLCEELGIEYVHLRIFSVYGPGDHPWTLVSQCLESFTQDRVIELTSCEQTWNFLHVEDAARAIYQLANCDLKGQHVFNIAGDENIPLYRYVDIMWHLCGNRGMPAYGRYANPVERIHGIEPSIDRLKRVTGWQPQISFEDGIREMIGNMEDGL